MGVGDKGVGSLYPRLTRSRPIRTPSGYFSTLIMATRVFSRLTYYVSRILSVAPADWITFILTFLDVESKTKAWDLYFISICLSYGLGVLAWLHFPHASQISLEYCIRMTLD